MTRTEYGLAYIEGFKRTFKLLLSKGASPEDANEIAQAAWVRGFVRLSQFRDECRVVGWVNQIALNLLEDFRRGRRFEELSAKDEPTVKPAVNLSAIDVARAKQACTARQWQVTDAVYLNERSCREVASQFGMSLNAVHALLRRARLAMQGWMGKKSAA